MAPRSQKLEFPGSQGHTLAARLDLPAGPARAFALFAHCFTCSKDIWAASRIAKAMSNRGFAVMRFDFTGLGASDGEFANTNFTSNVQDLIGAADYLRENHCAPEILIGHSLGGAAVLAAAPEIEEVRAVATIGAPADAAHVVHNFGAKIAEIEREGEAEVSLAGRNFKIKRQFLDDLKEQSVRHRLAEMKKALLVMHAPRDEVVGIDNASEIFMAAKHPKSFVSLDDADHLLSRREDGEYVAEIISAWASRYIAEPVDEIEMDAPPKGVVRVKETGKGKFQQSVRVGQHAMLADEPEAFGGFDSGPSPYDYLSIALGACTSMTMRMYASHKSLPVERIQVDVKHRKIHAEDCKDCGEGREGRIDRFERILRIDGALSEDHLARLVEIADKCPVHKTLEAEAAIVTRLDRDED